MRPMTDKLVRDKLRITAKMFLEHHERIAEVAGVCLVKPTLVDMAGAMALAIPELLDADDAAIAELRDCLRIAMGIVHDLDNDPRRCLADSPDWQRCRAALGETP